MNSTMFLYLCIFLPVIVLYLNRRKQKKHIIKKHIQSKKQSKKHIKENEKMIEFVKQFIGVRCIIYTFDTQLNGTIKEVSESGDSILLENGDNIEIVNLEYVTRIRKYPVNKKGKYKSVILD